jgi:hypothetical protein
MIIVQQLLFYYEHIKTNTMSVSVLTLKFIPRFLLHFLWVFVKSAFIGFIGALVISLFLKFQRFLFDRKNAEIIKTKKCEKCRVSSFAECGLFFLFSLSVYNLSELFDGSGAVTIIAYSLTFTHYGFYNLTYQGMVSIEFIFPCFDLIIYVE